MARSMCCSSVIDAKFTAGYADVGLSYSSSQNGGIPAVEKAQ